MGRTVTNPNCRIAIDNDGARILAVGYRTHDGHRAILARTPDGVDWLYMPDDVVADTGEVARTLEIERTMRARYTD